VHSVDGGCHLHRVWGGLLFGSEEAAKRGADVATVNDGGPAAPICAGSEFSESRLSQSFDHASTGLSIRDWFAGMALAGLLPKLPLVDQQGEHGMPVADKIAHNRDIAESCYCIADAMLAERSK
jgi:hypothetical protein